MRGGRVRVRKELALIPIICVNSFVVVLMLFSGFGISAISSVPYAFNQVSALTEKPYSRVKICFDVTCLTVTALVTWAFAGGIRGLGLGTVLAAFTMGKVIGKIGEQLDQRVEFI